MALLFAAPRAALRLFLQTAFIAPSPQTRHITQSDFDQRLKEHSGTANVSLDRGGLVRNITKLELGLLVGAILATRIAHAEELAPVTIQPTFRASRTRFPDNFPRLAQAAAGSSAAERYS